MMSCRRLLTVLVIGALAAACGPKRVPSATPSPPAMIVLLPDQDTGLAGRARVTNQNGSADLNSARDAVHATSDRRPGPVTTLDDSDVTRLFGDALDALPPMPRHFMLRFSFESDELTPESRTLVPEILSAVKAHPAPEVFIVGHTDTMGDADANIALGLKRALTIRRLLVDAGIDDTLVVVSSHGESDLLVRTRNNRPEPRNRRVEIVVR